MPNLIDKDKLAEKIKDLIKSQPEVRLPPEERCGARLMAGRIYNMILSEETIVTKQGEWEKIGETKQNEFETEIEEKCSLCGRHVTRFDTQPKDNFCPTCGAKMNV